MEWRKLPVPLSELCLASVLRCGQSFRWKSSGPDEWSCALRGRILTVRQDPTHLYYHAIFPSSSVNQKSDDLDDTADLVRDYFNLSVDLTVLYEKWSSCDPHFKKTAPKFAGIRMLRQDPWENLISFICSSNNNIIRISQMVENLCVNFGAKLGQLGGVTYYDFPIPTALTPVGIEEKLRVLGFGYRAKYIHKTARMIVDDYPTGWLDGLRNMEYKDAHEALLQLQGVGPKVADCVCLMSLDKTEAVPVDTHVWQIAMRDYKFGKGKHKSLTKATYTAIGDHFRGLWGSEAGWAHSVLFTADLKLFAEKGAKVEGVVTSPTKNEERGKVKQEVGFIAAMTPAKRGKKPKAEPKGQREHENSVEVEVGVTVVATVKKEKRRGVMKATIIEERSSGGIKEVDAGLATMIKRSETMVKLENEEGNEGGDNLRALARLEEVVEKTVVKEERSLKRGLKFRNEKINVKLEEDLSGTMADRIKRRRRG